MKYIFPILLTLALLTACAPNPDQPISGDDPAPIQPEDYLPRPGDGKLVRGTVYLDSTDLLTMESYPLQFSLTLTGNLSTPCEHLRVAVSQPDAENRIMLEVYSVSAPELMCSEVLAPFAVTIPLGSFPQGQYTLWVNGEKVAEFDA